MFLRRNSQGFKGTIPRNEQVFWPKLYELTRGVMAISIGCKELEFDCRFVMERETGKVVVESLMHHIHKEKVEDWFEIEEIYQATCKTIREKTCEIRY
jgi:hypothetical protein